MSAPALLVPDDPRHGVARCARELREEVRRRGVPEDPFTPGGRVHVHFTDRLHGRDADEAAGWFAGLAGSHAVSVTLHDLPQASDGSSYDVRARCYARVAAASRGVAVNSEHERALLGDLVPVDAVRVVPLAMPHPAEPVAGDEPRSRPPVAAVLGFFYPGKGHEPLLDALVRLRGCRPDLPKPGLGVLGAASPGHEGELAALTERARRAGVPTRVTGYLDDAALVREARAVAVPVVAHEHVSASGSLNSWVAAGRRPLVRDGRYAREMAGLRPGTLTTYPPDGLAAALGSALADPGSTWLGPDAVLGPHVEDVAVAYLSWWEGLPW